MEELLPDDKLDALFRKSAEEFEPTFEPKAWEAMRKKLEKPERDPAGWLIGGAVGILLLLGVGYWWLNRQNQSVAIQNTTTTPDKTQSTTSTSTENIKEKANTNNITLDTKSAKNDANKPVATAAESSKSDANIATTQLPAQGIENIAKANSKTTAPKLKGNQVFSQKQKKNLVNKYPYKRTGQDIKDDNKQLDDKTAIAKIEENVAKEKVVKQPNKAATNIGNLSQPKFVADKLDKSLTTTQQISQDFQNTPSEVSPTSLPNSILANIKLNQLSIKPIHLTNLVLPTVVINYQPPIIPTENPKEEPPASVYKKGLSIRIAASPDWSYITQVQATKDPKIALAAMLEYRFAKRWSVQVGIAKSMKSYTATGDQYIWPESWSTQKARPIAVGAECKVLDIPINIRFDILQTTRSRWFIASGISSYRMLNEKYTYTYAPHTYGIKWHNWEGSTGNYWGGILNLSTGIEKQLFERISLQIEPSFKLPISQVGMGKVKLRTTGIFVSAKYLLFNK